MVRGLKEIDLCAHFLTAIPVSFEKFSVREGLDRGILVNL